MPTYTYECPKCDQTYQIVHKMDDKPSILCSYEGCNEACVKIITGVNVVVPNNMRSCPSMSYHGKQLKVPINILDQDSEGNITKVTTISKDGREPEPID